MTLLDLFSKRQRRARGENSDIYQYDNIPNPLRVQIIHIIRDAFGDDSLEIRSQSELVYTELHQMLAREFGVFQLAGHTDAKDNLYEFILKEPNIEKVLDAVELSFKLIQIYGVDGQYIYRAKPRQNPADAVEELNARFREHAVGYQYESGSIIKADSQYVHAEVVKPALVILTNTRFTSAQKEFLNAHDHYRHGRYEEAITEALKSFESTLKSICKKRRWPYKDTDTAKQLLDICIREGLISSSLQSEFTALRSVLESGVPTIRNKQGGHGAGPAPRTVPDHLAAYALHLTAASIIFLTAGEAQLT